MHGLFVALRLLKNREMRRLMAALVAYSLTEHATWLALMVFAFQRGGVAETGVALFAMLVPAAFIAPIASRAIGPLGSGRALTLGFAIQAVLLAATAAVLVADAPARSVEELTAANATSSLVAMIGLFAGPAAAGIVLAGTSLSTVFWLTAALMAIATLLVVGFAGADDRADAVDGSAHAHEAAHLTTDGGTDTAEARSVRLLIGLQGLVFALVGALDVAFVAMAVELLERSEATAGALNAAHGFGAFVGAVASLSLVGRRRLTPAIAVASSAAGLSVAALAAVGDLWPALGLLALAGAGRAVSGVASRTMLQGLSPSDTLGRVFGALEGMSMLALAIGALLFSVAADRLGLETAFMVTGLLLPSVIGLSLARLAAIDRQRPTVDAELVTLLRSTPVFGPLPPYAIEHMIANLGRRTFAADETIISTGDDGDEIFVIVGGDVDVIRANGDPVTRTAGDYFGEIALLFDRPRTATVVAGADGATTLTIDRETYRSAIGVNPLSHGRVAATARRLLDDNGAD